MTPDDVAEDHPQWLSMDEMGSLFDDDNDVVFPIFNNADENAHPLYHQ
jgi:hypothetical protein